MDNRLKACFLSERTHWRQPVLSWALSRGIQLPEGIDKRDIKLAQTEHQLTHNWHINAASLWHHQYMYVYVRTRSPRNSVAIKHMRKQCVPGTLSPPPPPHMETRLEQPALCHWATTAGQPPTLTILHGFFPDLNNLDTVLCKSGCHRIGFLLGAG